jgi:hypothetical protein
MATYLTKAGRSKKGDSIQTIITMSKKNFSGTLKSAVRTMYSSSKTRQLKRNGIGPFLILFLSYLSDIIFVLKQVKVSHEI